MAAKCTGIKIDGFPCEFRARPNNDQRCAIHQHDKYGGPEMEEQMTKGYLIGRYTHLTVVIDYMRRIPFRTRRTLLRLNAVEISAIITDSEALIRGDYPGYTGPFNKAARWIEYRQNNHRALAEQQVMRRGMPQHITLMHQWYAHFRILVSTVFPGIGGEDLYNPEYVTTTFTPQFLARYDEFTPATKVSLRACFENLGVLGQAHIAVLGDLIPRVPARVQLLEGERFVRDNQNVHREATVRHVTDIFNRLIEIRVPPDQNTLGNVIMHCSLPPQAIVHLTRYYCEPTEIYGIPRAYPRALDAVWAYVSVHPERAELCSRIRDELVDNIGMCAQGNLSRICNMVTGYIDGIQPVVAQGELLQNRISAIASDSNDNKIERAVAVFHELQIPEDQWAPWIEAIEGV